MNRSVIFFISLLNLFSYQSTAQQKYKIVEQSKFSFSSWYNIFAYSKYRHDRDDLQFDLASIRVPPFQFGFLSAFAVSDPNWVFEDGSVGQKRLVLVAQFPCGIYFPFYVNQFKFLPYSIGFGFKYYMIEPENLPYEEEILKKLKLPQLFDLSLLFDTNYFAFEVGYRFQSGEYLWPDERYESGYHEVNRLDGFYFKVSAGLTFLKLKEKIVKKKYYLPSPLLKIYSEDSDEIFIFAGEKHNLSFIIENEGPGSSEKIQLHIYAKTENSDLKLIRTHYVGDLKPISDKRFFIPIHLSKEIKIENKVTFYFICLDQDGFRAYNSKIVHIQN